MSLLLNTHERPDWILAATARLKHLTLLTADGRILEYPHVDTVDAKS